MILIIIVIIINVIMVAVDKVLPVTCLHTRPVCGTAGTGLKKQNQQHFFLLLFHFCQEHKWAKSATFPFCFRSIFVKYTNTFLPLFLTINFKLIMICKRTRLFLILSFRREQSRASEKITDNALSQYLLQWHQQTLLSSLSLGHQCVIVNLVMSPTCIKMYLLSLSSSQDLQIEQTSTYYFVTF